ncbi:MAG: ATP-binding protein, partial [Aldersonia sp.]|nr:ATP-binding protein [Aldersonia sp.]
WFAAALPPDRLVVGSITTAADLAALLDLPLASAVVRSKVTTSGRTTAWDREPLAVLVATTLELPLRCETLVLHSDLTVRLTGAVDATVRVPFWVDGDGVTHLQQLSSA